MSDHLATRFGGFIMKLYPKLYDTTIFYARGHNSFELALKHEKRLLCSSIKPTMVVYGLGRRAKPLFGYQATFPWQGLYQPLGMISSGLRGGFSPPCFDRQTTNSPVVFLTVLFLGRLTSLFSESLCSLVLHWTIIPSVWWNRKGLFSPYAPLNFRYLFSACFPYIIV